MLYPYSRAAQSRKSARKDIANLVLAVILFMSSPCLALDIVPAEPTTDDSVRLILRCFHPHSCFEVSWGLSVGAFHISGGVYYLDYSDTARDCVDEWVFDEFVYEAGKLPAGVYHWAIIQRYCDLDDSCWHGDDFGEFTVRQASTGIDEKGEHLPASSTLAQNYPNPFNPTTNIHFDLPRASHVSLDIFNVLGQRVNTLVNQRLSAGQYDVTWDGTTDARTPVASGVYFYRLRTDTYAETKKMVLLK